MRVAVVGTGISGLVVAYLLASDHDITVYEANDYIGGHTNTVTVPTPNGPLAIDTGFIVCNTRTYPNFLRLLDRLGVALQPSFMSFSVHSELSNVQYCGATWNGLFAQRRNFFRPSFWSMIRDILRFNREAPTLLESEDAGPTLQEYLQKNGFGTAFKNDYLLPMGAAIWSADLQQMLEFPARYFIQFFHHHGLLTVNDQPQWLTIPRGSKSYVEKITERFRSRIRLNSPVRTIRRYEHEVEVETASRSARYDHVVIAAHSDQALRMLADPSSAETEILGGMGYQPNEAVLHTDPRMMPSRRAAWASWNYHVPKSPAAQATVTYWMNLLQNLETSEQYFVTLNRTAEIEPSRIVYRAHYHHPIYNQTAVAAQQRWAEISGPRRTHFCGAYWGYGFHEDGVQSGLRVAGVFGKTL